MIYAKRIMKKSRILEKQKFQKIALRLASTFLLLGLIWTVDHSIIAAWVSVLVVVTLFFGWWKFKFSFSYIWLFPITLFTVMVFDIFIFRLETVDRNWTNLCTVVISFLPLITVLIVPYGKLVGTFNEPQNISKRSGMVGFFLLFLVAALPLAVKAPLNLLEYRNTFVHSIARENGCFSFYSVSNNRSSALFEFNETAIFPGIVKREYLGMIPTSAPDRIPFEDCNYETISATHIKVTETNSVNSSSSKEEEGRSFVFSYNPVLEP